MASKLVTLLKPHHSSLLRKIPARLASAVAAEETQAASETDVSTSSNGLTIASQNTGGEACTVGLWVDAGARCESPGSNGAANFLEHMLFKGTQNRTQAQLESEIKALGAQFSAHTGREQIAYTAKCLKKDLPAVVDILADVVQNPLLDEETLEKERDTVLMQIEDAGGDLEKVVMDYLHTTAYQGSSLSQSVMGPTANIKSLSKSDLLGFLEGNFTPSRMFLCAAGGVDHAALADLAESKLTSLYAGGAEPDPGNRFSGSSLQDRCDTHPYAHVAFAIESCGWTHPDFWVTKVAQAHIGSWTRSLAGAHSQRNSLPNRAFMFGAELYNCFNVSYTETSLFGVHCVADAKHIDDALEVCQLGFVGLCSKISDSDVAIAKTNLKTNLCLQLADADGLCANIGQHMLTMGRHMPLQEIFEVIDEIETAAIQEVCTKYINDKCPAVAAVGPVEAVGDYNTLRSRMNSKIL